MQVKCRDVRESVQAEAGRILCYSLRCFPGMPRPYAQFHLRVLLFFLDLLDRIPVSDRCDAMQICLRMSEFIN